MNRTLTVSESTYTWLQSEAKRRGLGSVEELLEAWQAENDELRQRHEVVARIKALSDRLDAKYGEQSDSVDLIREDRDQCSSFDPNLSDFSDARACNLR